MKKQPFVTITIIVLFSLCIISAIWLFSSSNGKIVYVDSNKLLAGYKGMVDARAGYSKKENVWKANIDTLTQDVKDAMRNYNEALAKGNDKETQKAKSFISLKQKQLYDYQNAIKQNAADEEGKANEQVFSTINAFLESYGKKHGYRFILIAANGNIGYADKSADITTDVVDALNKEYYPQNSGK